MECDWAPYYLKSVRSFAFQETQWDSVSCCSTMCINYKLVFSSRKMHLLVMSKINDKAGRLDAIVFRTTFYRFRL